MTLEENDPRLTAYALGELDEAERGEVEQALKDDAAGRLAVEETRRVAGLLTEELKGEPAPKLTAGRRLAARRGDKARPARRMLRLWIPLAAAAMVLAALSAFLLWRENSGTGGAGANLAQERREPERDRQPHKVIKSEFPPEFYGTPEPKERQASGKNEEVKIELPGPQFRGTLQNLRSSNLPPKGTNPYPNCQTILVPKETTNVALKKPVTASDSEPIIGELNQVTDGDKEGVDGSYVELGPGLQWVQIDLEADYDIHAIAVWHDHREPCVFRDVVVQVSDDKDFVKDVRTVFNNDHDNSSGLGVGKDYEWIERNFPRIIEPGGVRGRYVRLYSNGRTGSDQNTYTEVEVYGTPAGGDEFSSKKHPPAVRGLPCKTSRR